MSNRFEHLKNKGSKSRLSREEFVEMANEEQADHLSKFRPNQKDILLTVAGRINRSKSCGKPYLIYLKREIEHDIQKYCYGNRSLIINYLIKRGLKALVTEGKLQLYMED